MKQYTIEGTVKHNESTDGWYLDTKDVDFTSDVLTGIDEIMTSIDDDITCNGDVLEITITIKNR